MQQPPTNQKIANPKPPGEPQVKGPQMNDRDRANDVLATEKYLCHNYTMMAIESSHHRLHQDVLAILNETHQCQRRLFNLMFEKGWYKLEAAPASEVQNAYQQFAGYRTQFPLLSAGGATSQPTAPTM
ncbi:MAG TPA: spore coat protein [Calditerricola sp.]